jgi:hypothetical protein
MKVGVIGRVLVVLPQTHFSSGVEVIMNRLILASGKCYTCNVFLKQVGSSKEDAELLLRHGHGFKKHIFHGELSFSEIDNEKARKIEKEQIP